MRATTTAPLGYEAHHGSDRSPKRPLKVMARVTATISADVERYSNHGTEATLLPAALQRTTPSSASGLLMPVAMKKRS